jgi:hypothetical protein
LSLLLLQLLKIAMFLYPEHSQVERILPKNKIYGHAQPNRATRQRFIDQVEQILWRYKLAPETIHLPAKSGVEEIQVFEIALKSGELRDDVLRTIDRSIPSLLFFELTFQGKVRFSASYKRLSETGTNKAVVETYFQTPWQDSAAPRQPLPIALDMSILYEQMLRQHMLASSLALNSRAEETLSETIERGNRIRAMRRERQRLEIRLKKETQFNRKIEINAALRQCCTDLTHLERLDTPGL